MRVDPAVLEAVRELLGNFSEITPADGRTVTLQDFFGYLRARLDALDPADPAAVAGDEVAAAALLYPPESAGSWLTAEPGEVDAADELAIRHAVARGAFSAERAEFWRAKSAAGERVAATVSSLAVIQAPSPLAAASGEAYSLPLSRLGPSTAYGSLVAEIAARNPSTVAAARSEAPEPTLFPAGGGTASGLDPSLLSRLPWPAKLEAAFEPDRSRAFKICQEYAGEDVPAAMLAFGNSAAVKNHVDQVRAWLRGDGSRTPGPDLTSQEYEQLFGRTGPA